MRRALIVVLINIVFVVTDLWPGMAAPQQMRMMDLLTPDSVLRWINAYRQKPDPATVPDVVKALSRMNAFKDPESSGPYIGFIAGVIGSRPAIAVFAMVALAAGGTYLIVTRGLRAGLAVEDIEPTAVVSTPSVPISSTML